MANCHIQRDLQQMFFRKDLQTMNKCHLTLDTGKQGFLFNNFRDFWFFEFANNLLNESGQKNN